MAQQEVILPKMGESVAEATVIKWLKNPGDNVEADEPIVEIATDKVDTEVSAPCNGILLKQLSHEGDVVEVGKILAIIESSDSSIPSKPKVIAKDEIVHQLPDTEKAAIIAQKIPYIPEATNKIISITEKITNSDNFYSPLVKTIAEQEGITQKELDSIIGTGGNNRVTKKDILTYLENRKKNPVQQNTVKKESNTFTTAPKDDKAEITFSYNPENVEIIEMDRMRRMIADHMSFSKRVSPHVTSFVEADVTNIVKWRDSIKDEFERKNGEKLTFTPIFIEAIARALREFPMVNISVDGYKIIRHKQINIGLAVALPTGNLIVPVVKNADQLNLVGLAKKVNELSTQARINKLSPDDLQNGTFTLTNVGAFGNVTGTPILNQPQAAILAIGAIKKKACVIETKDGDTIGIRHMMFLSGSYDHRVIDGALGCMFLRKVGDFLEEFDAKRKI